jgi:hypothetical protein
MATRTARLLRAVDTPVASAPVREARPVRVLALGLLGLAAGAAAALVRLGAPLPPVGAVAVLVLLLGVAVNRGTFFPTELVATAEAAVLFAAVVGFRSDAAWLGPLVVALAVGPLDVVHWRQRAFVRMAYNSGSQGLAVLAGVAVFRGIGGVAGPSTAALLAAAVVAGVAYALVDSCAGVALLVTRCDAGWHDAVRHQWSLNALAVPLALVGAVAGILATGVGWWLGALVLAPVPWAPEVALVRARRLGPARSRPHVRVLVALVAIAVFVWCSFLAPSPTLRALPWLVVVAVAGGVELRVSARRAVPPLAALTVAAAVVVMPRDAVLLAGALSAITTATAWASRRRTDLRPALRGGAVAFAAAAGVGAAAVATTLGTHSSVGGVAVAVVGAVLYEIVVLASRRDAPSVLASLGWTAPLVMTAAALAGAWYGLGSAGAPLFAVGLTGALAAVAWAAAPPWDSRLLGPLLATRARGRLRAALLVLVAASVTTAAAADAVDARQARTILVLVAVAQSGTVVAIALATVRQWRFVPRWRRRDAAGLTAIAVLVGAGYLPLGAAGAAGSSALLAVVLVGTVVSVWRLAGLADSAPAGALAAHPRTVPDAKVAATLERR